MPTRRNILDAMRWLVRDAQPHDSLFFHYSGHGGQIPDTNGDETDGLDEVIYPVDYKQAGIIVDDSCHSGTALGQLPSIGWHMRMIDYFSTDLPFVYRADGRLGESPVTQRARREMSTEADVISFSACRDDQTSADTTQRGVAVGAMSYAFITSLSE
ncbi:hypothetical protein ID866_10458 [Astraeus odoratus]|nr:hypothetical protein ID866_10458 [Astraeus odoratus]